MSRVDDAGVAIETLEGIERRLDAILEILVAVFRVCHYCDTVGATCDALGPGRKCCPDCRHGPA